MTKKSKSKKKKAKEVDPKEKERLDLLERAVALRGETEKENMLEAQFQAQSESLKQFWELEKKLREERRQQLREKEHRLQKTKDEHTVNLGEYKRTIKQLLFSNQDELSQNAIQTLLDYQSQSREYQREMNGLFNELGIATRNMEQTISWHQNLKNSLHHDSSEQITAVREDASRAIARLAAYTGNQLKMTHADFEKKLKEEIHQLELQNEVEIKATIDKNRQDMQDMRQQSNATINDNLDIITALTKELVMLREQYRKDASVLRELQAENEGIMTPLETNSNDLQRLGLDLDAFYKQKRDLETRRKQLKQAEEELNGIKWEHEVLFQHHERLEQECMECKKNYQEALYSAQQKSNMQNMKLERKLDQVTMEGEKSCAVLSQILIKADVDLDSVDHSIVADIVTEKTNKVNMLNGELSSIKDAHSTMKKRYRSLIDKPLDR
jgi:hypothetical protein